jgi:hypothetical protein
LANSVHAGHAVSAVLITVTEHICGFTHVGAAFHVLDTGAAKSAIRIHVTLGHHIRADELLFGRDTQRKQAVIGCRNDEAFFVCIALAILRALKVEARTEDFFSGTATGDRASIVIFKRTQFRRPAV